MEVLENLHIGGEKISRRLFDLHASCRIFHSDTLGLGKEMREKDTRCAFLRSQLTREQYCLIEDAYRGSAHEVEFLYSQPHKSQI